MACRTDRYKQCAFKLLSEWNQTNAVSHQSEINQHFEVIFFL